MPARQFAPTLLFCIVLCTTKGFAQDQPLIRVGMIGLDTSHCLAFTKVLNDVRAKPDVAGCRVVCAYPHGSRDIESSASRIPKYTAQMKEQGVRIAASIAEVLENTDVILLETNDGRLHLEQYLACAQAGKPVFIDKPVAAQLPDVIAIFQIADHFKAPMFSSSSLRFTGELQAVRKGKLGPVLGCDAFSPCSLEKTHSDLFWYGIHGVEILYTAMGTGCQTVTRTSTKGTDFVTGKWRDGRVGTFRGIRSGKRGYGGTAFGEKGNASVGGYSGYRPLLVEIVEFFKTKKAPVSSAETLELYAFMEAARISSQRGGVPVSIEETVRSARVEAQAKLKALLPRATRGHGN